MDTKYIIALEIGTSAVKAGVAIPDSDTGTITLVAAEEEPLNNSVRYGRIQNVEEVTRHTLLALDRLASLPEFAGSKITGVYTAVGGRSLCSVRTSARLVFPEESEITNDTIERLQEEAMAQVSDKQEVLDIIPLRFTVDDIATQRPVGAFGTRVTAEFTIVVCNPVNTRNITRVVADRLNLDICGFVVRPLALADLCLGIEDTKPGCMLVDVGAETTTVAIFKGGALHYLATIPVGSQHITRDLAFGLGVIDEQAESIKVRLGNAMGDPAATLSAEQRQIDNYVQARSNEIIANIVAQAEFAGFQSGELRAGIIVTGRGAKLKNFCKQLEVQSHMTVRAATVPPSVRVSNPALSGADLLPLMAVAAEGARMAVRSETPDCVEPVAQPVVEAAPEVDDTPKETVAAIEIDAADKVDAPVVWAGQPAFNSYDTDPAAENARVEVKPYDEEEEELLLDDDEAERRRNERAEKARAKAEKEQRRREREAQKQAGKEQQQKRMRVGVFDRLKDRINRMVTSVDDAEGVDLADDDD